MGSSRNIESKPMKESYIIAGQYPIKMLANFVPQDRLDIMPAHISFNLTNACQLKCDYCAVKDRSGPVHMQLDKFMEIVDKIHGLGHLRAATITGGGDPLLYPYFAYAVKYLLDKEIRVSLITNGIAIKDHSVDVLNKLSWIRISYDSSREEFPEIPEGMKKYGISYLYRPGDEIDPVFNSLIEMARKSEITHLRVGQDILNASSVKLPASFWKTKGLCAQDRSVHYPGPQKCWVGLIRPKIDVDGKIYACCGAQYAITGRSGYYPEELCLGGIDEYLERVVSQKIFDGQICNRCYYIHNNYLLDAISNIKNVEYLEFV